MNRIIGFISPLLVVGVLFVGSAFSGEGRQRISSNSSEYSDVSDIEAEIRFGRDLAARILGNYNLLNDEEINRYVNLVGKALALYAGRPELRYHFGVLDSDEINAFAAPGGYIFITRGALVKMDNEAHLAAVLAHEIGHVVKKHVVKELNIRGEEGSGAGGLATLIGGATAGVRGALEQALDDAADILFNRGYKVKDEIEADRVGILLASVAGYDPSALREFLTKVKSFEKEDTTYKGEHPIFQVRMREIGETLKAHGLQDVKKSKAKDRFYENIKK
jgi:predicted Zn-dependent protease